MAFDASTILALLGQLILKTFESRNEEKLEERLKRKSKDDIEKILLSKNISATRKAINLEKEKREKLINQVTKNLKVYEAIEDSDQKNKPDKDILDQETKNLKVYHLGQNTTYPSISELITNLIKRD